MSYVYTSSNQWSQNELQLAGASTSTDFHYGAPLSHAPGYGFAAPVPVDIIRPSVVSVPHQVKPVVPISSFSTLSGALDYANVTTSPSSKNRAHQHAVYKSRTTSSYPASQHDIQSRSGSSSCSQSSSGPASPTPSSSRSLRGVQGQYHPQDVTLPLTQQPHAHPHPQRNAQSQSHPHHPRQIGASTGPTNHVMVPQVEYQDDERDRRGGRHTTDLSFRHDTITFQTANIPELGVRVGKISHSHYPPPIQGPDDEVFAKAGDREVRLWIQWPGYSAHPLQKRVKTQGGKLTRQLLLTHIANMVLDFAYDIHRKKIPVERGYSEWAIGERTKNNGIVGAELFITRLVHCGGSNWQPEIWAPRHW